MPDQQVVLAEQEWQQILAVMCNAQGPGITWAVTNPLIMKLGEQLRAQTPTPQLFPRPNGLDDDLPDDAGSHRRVPRAQ